MTRKHFQAIADALAAERPDHTCSMETLGMWATACHAMADVCAQFNGNFDRGRFLAACGVQ